MIRKLGFALVLGVAALISAGSDLQASSFAPITTAELADSAPGANSSVTTTFTLNSPDAMFQTLVTFIPPEFGVAAGSGISDGSVVGHLVAAMNFGLIGSACSQLLEPEWKLLDASTNIADMVSFEDLDVDGTRDYAEDENGDGLRDSVLKYPEPLTRILPGITPRARMFGLEYIAGTPYMFNFLVLEPGTGFLGLSPSASLGYPVVVTSLDNGDSQKVPEPGAITDLCSYFHMTVQSYGITQNNPLTLPTEGGQVYRTNPAASGTYPFVTLAESPGDADGDGIENELDVCPLTVNVGDPRVSNSGDMDGDGMDAACDPNDDPNTGGTNSDQDGDGYLNRQDNCPLVQNGQLGMNQADTDLDGIGDNCDPSPATADGHKHSVCLVDEVVVGGGGTPTGSSCDADGDGVLDGTDNCPTVPNPSGQTDDADGDLAGDACDAPGTGNVDCSGPANGVGSVDALKVLRHNAGLSVAQSEPCLDIGQPRALPPPDNWLMGDVDCSGVVNSVDALKILRAGAGLSVAYVGVGCPEVKPP